MGDFNEILYSNEMQCGNFNRTRALALSFVLDDYDLWDLDTNEGLFTLRKNTQHGGNVRKKLNRWLANATCRLAFLNAMAKILPMHSLDHNPILLKCLKFAPKKVPYFHFLATWMGYPNYGKVVNNVWFITQGDVFPKLQGVKEKSIFFNNNVFGNIFKRKRLLETRIRGINQQLDLFPFFDLI